MLEDGDVGVGILPQSQETLIGDAGFFFLAGGGKGAAKAEAGKRTVR